MRKMFFFSALLCACISCNTPKNSSSENNLSALKGTWYLNYISGPRIAFEGLYPERKPMVMFEIHKNKVTGNTGCNNFSGTMNVDGKKINFPKAMAMVMTACPGEGENVFIETLKKINSYEVTAGYTLTLLTDNVPMMRFTRAH